jgi:Glycosyl transferase family 2
MAEGRSGISVLTPVRREGHSILRTLPGLWTAARNAGADIHLLVAKDAPAALRATRAFSRDHPYCHVHSLATVGKFPALQFGADVSEGTILVPLDADVHPAPDAIARVVEPIVGGKADASGARISTPARLSGQGALAPMINHWEQRNCAAWHLLRSEYPGSRWCMPGGLYAVRREVFPSQILVPLLDDASVGIHLLESGARCAYVPGSRLDHASPASYESWLRRKIRHRRGWMALSVRRPRLVAEMRSRMLFALDAVLDPADGRDQLLRLHMRAIWTTAGVAEHVFPSAGDSW